MICRDYENQIPILQSMIFFGALIGFFFIPTIADNSGRKEGLKIAMIIGIIGSILLSIADSPKVTGFALFFIGFGTNPAITLAFSFINEQCLGKSRQRFGVGVQIGLALGETLIALIFLTGLTWREIMYMLIGFFMMTYIAIELILKETPLYLIEKNPQQTLKVLNEMAKINKREPISS